MKTLTLDEILAADDVTIEAVDVPAWGGQVFVRSVSGNKRDEFDESYARNGNGEVSLIGVRAKLVGMCLCDESGASLSPTENQLKALGKKSSAMLDKVFEVCQRINGMLQKDIEKLEKNLPAEDGSDSG